MATIIDFPASDGRTDLQQTAGRNAGEVIIFPGVRRERHGEATPAAKPRRRERGKPKRDRIELPE